MHSLHNSDTIAAISTALGESGIAVIRISGTDAVNICSHILRRKKLEIPKKLYLTSLIDDDNNIIDRVLAVRFEKPESYTGEDSAEIHTHGGILIARTCLELAIKNGARIAEAGEFTRRAFINGKMDLSQAEGVLSVIKSRSIEALHAAARTLTGELSRAVHKIHDDILILQGNFEIQLDFPEGETLNNFDASEGIANIISELELLLSKCSAGTILRDGVRVVIAGSPNAGKSSLMNAILDKKRAIVTEIPGTTRDIIEESIIIDGIPIILTDTAGLRESEDVIESEGIRLALEAMNESDICLYVVDSSRELTDEEKKYIALLENRNAIIVLNKSDLEQVTKNIDTAAVKISVSAKKREGIEDLKREIYNFIVSKNSAITSGLNVSARQLDDIRSCLSSMREARYSALNSVGEDITAGMLNSARLALLRVLGLDGGEEVLDSMFSRFCVGK